MKNKMQFSIIIPCYNEAKLISSTLDQVENFFKSKNWSFEIIVIDDGSTDQTAELASKFNIKLLKNEKNQGKGYSISRGVQASSGELILFTDADLSTPIEELEKLLLFIPEYDIVIGSRAMADSQIEKSQPWYKEGLGKMGNLLIRLILGLKIKDTQCGFKLFKRKVIDIFERQTINGWGFDFEILFIAQNRGYQIKEVAVRWLNEPNSKVTVSGYLRTVEELLRVRWNSWRGKY